jgi:hypothetical protein
MSCNLPAVRDTSCLFIVRKKHEMKAFKNENFRKDVQTKVLEITKERKN